MNPRSASRGRLSRSADFERVYRQGRSIANRHLVLYAFGNQAGPETRLGLSVSRKVGGAVQRNQVKRLLREAFAQVEPELQPGHDVVVVANARGTGGEGLVDVQSVSIDGVEVPRFILELFIEKFLQPNYPNIGLRSRFSLPQKIDTAVVGTHKLTLIQK